mmetsp:Transcript_28574/g.36889  ORF Transcript_28574/g.36889 Transcript_28574/m.36889 type:complete len:176 (-) Transcript_28574:125-652(-)
MSMKVLLRWLRNVTTMWTDVVSSSTTLQPSGYLITQTTMASINILTSNFCILQLLLSIVGNVAKRCQTITTAYHSLKKGGYIYLSCSGVSDTINSNYKQLYERDYPATQEMYTYYSRGANIDNILYSTHHFTVNEITKLLKEGGFVDVHVQEIQERSSRRPEEVANFLYAMARKP